MMLTHYERHSKHNFWKLAQFNRKNRRNILEAMPKGEVWKLVPQVVSKAKVTPDSVAALLPEIMDFYLTSQEDAYSYGALLENEDFLELSAHLLEKLFWRASDLAVTMTMTYQMLSHERAGKRVYLASDGLAEQLAHTELRGLVTEDLRLPYESIVIQLPESSDFKVWNKDTGWHKLRDIYITEESRVSLNGSVGECRGWRLLLCGESKNGDDQDDALSHFWVPLPSGQKLDESLAITEKLIGSDSTTGKSFGPMAEAWRPIFQWAMNVVLYATWSDPGERIMQNKEARQLWNRAQKIQGKSSRKKDLISKFQKLDAQQRIVLGSTIRIQRNNEPVSGTISGNEQSSGNSLLCWVRTRVSGHWRNQPYGPESSLRKIIWIAPFWKGPEDAPVRENKHVVG